MISILGLIFAVGSCSVVLCGFTGLTIFGLMATGIIKFDGPPKWLNAWLLISGWIAIVSGVPWALYSR